MSITENDVKLMAAERLTDNDDGGGQMSAVEIMDGVVNNLFPDISRLDRTYGRVNLRKLYAAVRTANTDTYYGSHVIVADAPDDPNVSITLFTTDSYTDERTDAQDRIESYVVTGPVSPYTLLGDQLKGQRMVTLYSRVDATLPEVGQVYLLSEEDDDGTVVGEQQYVRIDTVEHEIREFEDDKGVFERRVYSLGIGSALTRTFAGPDTASRYSDVSTPTLFRQTQVADAAQYYGIVPLAADIAAGDMSLQADSIYGQLVPSATVESAVTDVQAGSDRLNIVAAGPVYSVSVVTQDGSVSFGRPVVRGSVTLAGGADNRLGQLIRNGAVAGQIDYATGVISDLTFAGAVVYAAQPAVAVYDTAHTESEAITLANRGYNYIKTLSPIPQPGTLYVDYMAQGQWYRMTDNGKGVLSDEVGGTGSISYSTGSVIATLAALPDTGSQVIYTYATPSAYDIRTDDVEIKPGYLRFTVSAGEILPGTLSLSWEAGGQTQTATDDGNGTLTGAATGSVIYGTGEIGLRPTLVPDSGAVLTFNYKQGNKQTDVISTYTLGGDDALFTLSHAPVRPGTFTAVFDQDYLKEDPRYWGTQVSKRTQRQTVTDDGNGNLSNGGTINYTTGEVVVTVNSSYTRDSYGYGQYGTGWDKATINGVITAYYQQASVAEVDQEETQPLPDVQFDLTPTTLREVVAGSVELVWNGNTYIDRDGVIYTDWDRQSGAATAVGSIDYVEGVVTLTSYTGGGSNALSLRSLLTARAAWAADSVYFRTAGAPMRPSSFFIRATLPNGTAISANADGQGKLSSNAMTGAVDYETGIVQVRFGKSVLASSLTEEQKGYSWYSDDDVDADGMIWVPAPVIPTTIKYNTVVYSMMPLNASILGLDPVRLPIDGRVPIIRQGDVIVIHSTNDDTLPTGLVAGQQVALSRTLLARVSLADQAGTDVDTNLYSVDRETGIVTMAEPLDLTAYQQPLVATHRIEDMCLVNEAQVNGALALVGPVSRDYAAADTFISSALIFGDIGSRVHHLFSQATWSSVWADERSGNPTTAQYNDVLYPIQVNNKNAIRERWALIFTSATTFQIAGEQSGVIGDGNIATDCSPVNPVTGEPYFTVLAGGWGSGWASNNVLRFNTDAAHAPVWVARTTVSGAATLNDDAFRIEARGDAD